MKPKIAPTRQEVHFSDTELIVSKTDLTGRITYANRVFMRVCDYPEEALLGAQHNIIRHPDMPRGAFFGLWETLKQGQEFFAFVKNMTAKGDYYWVFANVSPDLRDGTTVGYFSVRRPGPALAVKSMEPIYRQMLEVEQRAGVAAAPKASWQWLLEQIDKQGTTYEKFILDLYQRSQE